MPDLQKICLLGLDVHATWQCFLQHQHALPSNCCICHPFFFCVVDAFSFFLHRYYELGPDDPPYAAKFYDCCGAENPEAPGCTVGPHISYDEE